jgi:adenylate cyclase
MAKVRKSIILGLVIGILGVVWCITPLGHKLEEVLGLHVLFSMRGQQQSPSDVVVVSIDKLSANMLNLPNNPAKWPHSYHAMITDYLAQEGARAIAFDVFFNDSRSEKDETLFSNAMKKAQNVILVEIIDREKISLNDKKGAMSGDLHIEKLLLPIPRLAESAFALAPFPLPKIPVKVSQYWTFKTAAGDTPTLPIVAFQTFSLEVYEEFYQLLKQLAPLQAAILPRDRDEFMNANKTVNVISSIRSIFESDPHIADRMIRELQDSERTLHRDKKKLLMSLIRMYKGPTSQYINFYGPPHSITTISYYKVLQRYGKPSAGAGTVDFRNKAVFIGSSELSQTELRDGFFTVFSQSDGLDISGVEIAATAFANLLEDIHVQSLPMHIHLFTVFFWGMMLGIFCCRFPSRFSVVSLAGMGALYFIFVHYQFRAHNTWYPISVPFTQVFLVVLITPIWKYVASKRAVKNFLHQEVVQKIESGEDLKKLKSGSQKIYGTCLITDIDGYTKISEAMEPEELNRIMNKYFETIFMQLKKHNVSIKKTIGDSILAAWKGNSEDVTQCYACISALDIENNVYKITDPYRTALREYVTGNGWWNRPL